MWGFSYSASMSNAAFFSGNCLLHAGSWLFPAGLLLLFYRAACLSCCFKGLCFEEPPTQESLLWGKLSLLIPSPQKPKCL